MCLRCHYSELFAGAQETGARRPAKKSVCLSEVSPPSEVEASGNAGENAGPESRAKTSSKPTLAPSSTPAAASLPKSPENGEADETVAPDEDFAEAAPVSVSTMELVRSPNKRRMAPRPPESADELLPASSLFARNPGANLKSDSPVVREKEKRERSSSCSPKFRKAVCDLPDPTTTEKQTVEAVSRRTISLSQDSLTAEKEVREEKKRGRSRRGFSLKRFLRMGSRKDIDMVTGQTSGARADEIPSTPQPKPRLEIIHPLELDGAAVEVVGNDRVGGKIGEDQTDSCGPRSDASRAARFPPPAAGKREIPRSPKARGRRHFHTMNRVTARPGKPPPPPRNQSLEDWSKLDSANKPARPPPPRAEAKLNVRSDKTSSKSAWRPTATTTSDSIYANLGKFRPIQCN